ncbi:hypothetical protein, partial [uncultured Chryseobacterium sp.]|uniref:hypothetical protein n=1 Tax=uncultured Chryseobacterium sp. TaxID=259322 RepID=UPI0026065559
MNNRTYLQDYDGFDAESQKILSSLHNSFLSESSFLKNNQTPQLAKTNSFTEVANPTQELINWNTNEYINLDLLITKIKSSNNGMNNYEIIYNPQDLKANSQNKTIQNKTVQNKNRYIRLKVYRNPDAGNVSVKWNNVRV